MATALVHLAGEKWRPGQPLICWDSLHADGILTDSDWGWPEAEIGQDGQVVCLFDLADQRERDEAFETIDAQPWRTALRVDLDAAPPGESLHMRTVVVSEGYLAVCDHIPAECLTVAPSLRAALDEIAEEQGW